MTFLADLERRRNAGGTACVIAPDQYGFSGQGCMSKSVCQPHGAAYAGSDDACHSTECIDPCR